MKAHPKLTKYYDISPKTFCLPKEYSQFSEYFHRNQEKEGRNNIWIVKPIGKSRGRGIQVVNEINQIMYLEPIVIQKYITNPLLINEFKFDMRIYVIVTSFNPLEVFLYKEGFGRMTSQHYNLDLDDLHNNFVHLTNVAINNSKNTQHIQNHYKDENNTNYLLGGSKVSLKTLKEMLMTRN